MFPRRIGPPCAALLDGGSVGDLLDGELGTVGDGEPRLVLELGRDGAVADHRREAVVVHREQFRGQAVAAGVAGALLLDDPDPHGKTTGTRRGPRTCPPAQVTSAPPASRNSA